MKVAIVGSGISGLTAAYRLSDSHQISLFETRDRLGGHTHSISVNDSQLGNIAVDNGFIVYNERNYPLFRALLDELDVPSQDSQMSFGLKNQKTRLEYAGSAINSLFAQRRRLLQPSHYRFLLEILKFGRVAKEYLGTEEQKTLGEFLTELRFSEKFQQDYLLPMAGAIWSASLDDIRQFPLRSFLTFFDNHGLLNLKERPQWKVICGGSTSYIKAMLDKIQIRVRTGCPVEGVERSARGVRLLLADQSSELFDQVILACHSDQALKFLVQPSDSEASVLGAISYSNNAVVLHTDVSVLPKSRRAWAAWNYRVAKDDVEKAKPRVTYNMNLLQGLNSATTYLVSLNQTDEIDSSKILHAENYAHPQFSLAALDAQQRWGAISGKSGIHYCGAYWGYGFHEDGVRSAERVVAMIGEASNA